MQLISREEGNISIISVIVMILILVTFLALFDLAKIFIFREQTKRASEAVCLAVAQDKLFFEQDKAVQTAKNIASDNNCMISRLVLEYDEVEVEVEKKAVLLFLDRFFKKELFVRSASSVKIHYPWDDKFGYCDNYYFQY